jgi:Arc/MetJ family transcription regulator
MCSSITTTYDANHRDSDMPVIVHSVGNLSAEESHGGQMTERLVDIDDEALEDARRALGTTTLEETVNIALRETGAQHRRPLTMEDLVAFAEAIKDARDPEVMARAWK